MGTLTEAWTAAALAHASAVGIALDDPDDPHAAVVVFDARVVYAGVSPGLQRGVPAADLQVITDSLTLNAVGLWAHARGTAAGFQLPTELRDPRRLTYATAGSVALAATSPDAILLDLRGITTAEPAALKSAAAERVRAVVGELDRTMRGKTTPPAGTSPAVLARRLIEKGERREGDHYRPGPGWETLIRGVVADAAMEQEKAND